jgi:hypothetical protein
MRAQPTRTGTASELASANEYNQPGTTESALAPYPSAYPMVRGGGTIC